MTQSDAPIKLIPSLHRDSWGKLAHDSLVAKLGKAGKVDAKERFSELWLGTHAGGEARAVTSEGEVPLSSLSALPFLLKILSVDQPLSIQVHPAKNTALELHRKSPDLYPDQNHKPEMACALMKGTLLYGWRKAPEITALLNKYPKLGELVSNRSSLAHMLGGLLKSESKIRRDIVHSIKAQLSRAASMDAHETLFMKCAGIYKEDDRGLLTLFFMNFVTLEPLQAVFVNSGVPHAYLSGDFVECMANSDNVVRLGLTRKNCDIETLLSLIKYDGTEIAGALIKPSVKNGIYSFAPPVAEFALDLVAGRAARKPDSKLEVLLLIKGKGDLTFKSGKISLAPGDAYFISDKCREYQIEITDGLMARAYVPAL
jgi:mannose-6-phosphate isomerase